MPLDIMMKAGDKIVDRQYITSLPVPQSTRTYCVVPHEKILCNIDELMKEHKPRYTLVKESFVTNRSEQRMFFKQYYQAPGLTDIVWGGRNGYDHMTAYAHGCGAGVSVCSNLQISGSDVNYVHDHYHGVWKKIVASQLATVLSVEERLEIAMKKRKKMQEIEISDRKAFEFLGFLRGTNKIKANQLSIALDHWINPPFAEFEDKTVWSLYNSATWAFGKSKDPQNILRQHTDFDEVMVKEFDLA